MLAATKKKWPFHNTQLIQIKLVSSSTHHAKSMSSMLSICLWKKKKKIINEKVFKILFLLSDFKIEMKIPQDKHSLQKCSCRCGARPLLFSGRRDCQSGWCWCSSVASVSTSEQPQRPARP